MACDTYSWMVIAVFRKLLSAALVVVVLSVGWFTSPVTANNGDGLEERTYTGDRLIEDVCTYNAAVVGRCVTVVFQAPTVIHAAPAPAAAETGTDSTDATPRAYTINFTG